MPTPIDTSAPVQVTMTAEELAALPPTVVPQDTVIDGLKVWRDPVRGVTYLITMIGTGGAMAQPMLLAGLLIPVAALAYLMFGRKR